MSAEYSATFKAYLYFKKLSLLFTDRLYLFTYNRPYYLFDFLNRPWQEFYDEELSLRKKLSLPPYGLLAKITLRSTDQKKLFTSSQSLYNRLQALFAEVYGPFEEYPFKLRDKYRYSLIVKTKRTHQARKAIIQGLNAVRSSSLRLAIILQ